MHVLIKAPKLFKSTLSVSFYLQISQGLLKTSKHDSYSQQNFRTVPDLAYHTYTPFCSCAISETWLCLLLALNPPLSLSSPPFSPTPWKMLSR